MRGAFITITAICLLSVAKPGFAQALDETLVLDHVGIQAVDLERSVAFYTQVLSFKEVTAPFPKTAARWIEVGDGRRLHIVAGGSATADHNKWDHFALSCRDIAKVEADLDRLNVRWTSMDGRRATDTRPDGTQQIFIRDPDGYSIEINDGLRRR